jgi:hypothetical protein
MCKFSTCTAIASWMLVLMFAVAGAQSIPDPRLCPEIIDEWLAHAQELRQLGGCGLATDNPYLSTDRAVQTKLCVLKDDKATEARTENIRETVARCTTCNAYARSATRSALDNVLFGCGFTGDRWTTSNPAHFNWCMNLQDCKPICVLWVFCYDACFDWKSLIDTKANPETAARTQGIAECRITHPEPTSCSACHSRQSSGVKTE